MAIRSRGQWDKDLLSVRQQDTQLSHLQWGQMPKKAKMPQTWGKVRATQQAFSWTFQEPGSRPLCSGHRPLGDGTARGTQRRLKGHTVCPFSSGIYTRGYNTACSHGYRKSQQCRGCVLSCSSLAPSTQGEECRVGEWRRIPLGREAPAPSHLLADISEQVVIGQGKAAHLLSQLQCPLGIERETQHFKGQQ